MGCVGAGKEGEWAAVYHQRVLWKYLVQSQSGYGELKVSEAVVSSQHVDLSLICLHLHLYTRSKVNENKENYNLYYFRAFC